MNNLLSVGIVAMVAFGFLTFLADAGFSSFRACLYVRHMKKIVHACVRVRARAAILATVNVILPRAAANPNAHSYLPWSLAVVDVGL